MASLSLGEPKWRMVRRVLRLDRFGFDDARGGHKADRRHFDWLVGNGFFADVGDGRYELTEKGKAAADMGLYEV